MKKILISFRIDEKLLRRINEITQQARYRTTSSVINSIIDGTLYSDEVPKQINFENIETRDDILVPSKLDIRKKIQKKWKPSLEQMDALANAIIIARNSGNKSANDLTTLHEILSKF